MIAFNERCFVQLGSELPAEASGFYQPNAGRGVHLYGRDGELAAYVVANACQGRFLVSASMQQGTPWYMHSTTSTTEQWLGIEGASCAAIAEMIKKIGDIPDTADGGALQSS
ncbi:Uncharacterised protein [Escherichia coli]|nr:Uncharacterised protein [Escherichia coli]